MSDRSMEMKVGALIIGAIVLMVGLVVMMGGLSLQPTYRIFVDFDDPGGLQSGAPVRISGVRIGRVTAIEFRGGELDAQGRPVKPIRVITSIEAQHKDAIHEDATFYVTSQGVLGEMYLAIDPGSYDKPPLEDGAVMTGVSPPRLDQLLGESYELLHRTYLGMVRNEKKISETFDGLHETLTTTGRLLNQHEQDISHIIQRLDALAAQSEETLAAAREQYVDGPRINRIMARLDNTTRVISENIEPLMVDSRAMVKDGRIVASFLADEEQLATYKALADDTRIVLTDAKAATKDARAIVAHVKAGRGTVGELAMDEALYDDLQELVRDLKHNPWKLLWRD